MPYQNSVKLKKYFLSAVILLSFSILWISWGSEGHSKISGCSALSFNPQMEQFQEWAGFLSDHASDPDYRKDTDPTEGAKHYIDIDNYSGFVATGRIPQTLDSAIAIYGVAFVNDNGFLPWATIASFDSLRNCMQRRDWAKAKIFAADLGHYIGDGHMALHLTKNYNGQLSGNNGIHSRFESTMINAYISEIGYSGFDASEVGNVNQFVFDYIYGNIKLVDSVIWADNYAKSLSSNYSSSTYKQALWDKSRSFTVPSFERASHALADLIFTAWLQAGSPMIDASAIEDPSMVNNATLEQNFPNPFASSTQIIFTLKENSRVLLQVRNNSGQTITTLINDTLDEGMHAAEWRPDSISNGLYYLVLNTGKAIQIRKMVFTN